MLPGRRAAASDRGEKTVLPLLKPTREAFFVTLAGFWSAQGENLLGFML